MPVGVIEEAECEFDAEETTHTLIQQGRSDLPLPEEPGEEETVRARLHIGVRSRIECQCSRRQGIAGDTVRDQLRDCHPVGDNETAKPPFISQDAGEERMIPRGRHTSDFIERTHHRERPCIHGGFIGGEIHFTQRPFGHVHGVVIPPPFGPAIGGKVLCTCGDRDIGGGIASLESPHTGGGHERTEKRILSGALGNPAPAGIARDVHHGGECPVDTGGGRLGGCHTRVLFHHGRVPAACLGKWYGECRAVAVYDVEPEKEWDLQA